MRAVRRAQPLLVLATGIGQQAAGQTVGLSRQAVSQVRRRCEEAGWQAALAEAPRSGGPRRFDGPQRAALTALACTPAPVGHSRWPLRLLADKAVELALVDAISHETVRQGTACLLAAFEPGTGQRLVEVSARRTGADYGRFLQRLAAHYPQAEKIGLVQDNGNTHADAVFYQHLPVAQARALAARFEGHYTPKNASWLNMVELELRPSPASACTNASPPWKNSPPTWPLAWPSGMRPAPRSTGNSPWKKLAPNSTATTRRLRQLTPLTEH